MLCSNLEIFITLMTSCVSGWSGTEGARIPSQAGKVSHVTLYRNQAMVTRSIDIQGGVGDSEVIVGELPENIVADSLFAEGTTGVEVRAVQFRTRAVGTSPREEVRQLEEQIVALQDKIQLNEKNAALAQSKMRYLDQLEKTVTPADPSDLSLEATDLEKMTIFLFEQREIIAPQQLELAKQQRELSQQLDLLKRQLNEH